MDTPLLSEDAQADDKNGDGIRQRRSGLSGEGKSKSSRRLLRYHVDEPSPEGLTDAQSRTFLNMYLRKVDRRVRGTKSNDSLCCEFVVVIILVVVLWSLGLYDYDDEDYEWTEADTASVVYYVAWWTVCLAVFFVWKSSPHAKMLRYMIVYIPLIFSVASASFFEEVRHDPENNPLRPRGHNWMFDLLVITEVLVFAGFMTYYNFWPLFVQSNFFRNEPGRVVRIWDVGSVQDWVMSYKGHNPARRCGGATECCQLNANYTCKYEGDVDDATGLPDGLGRWLDDAWEGESLTGYWKQGEPVAPFSSWNVGTDDAIVAVRVGYFKATDDPFSKNKFFCTNDQCAPECGVASVECSVSGSFYKHLPRATLIEGPYVVDSMPNENGRDDDNPIREALSHLFHVGEASEEADHVFGDDDDGGVSSVVIRATDPKGVQVLGHVYEPTGRFYSPDAKSITVDVEWGSPGENQAESLDVDAQGSVSGDGSRRRSVRCLQKSLFMPRASASPKLLSRLVEVEVEDSSDAESEGGEDEVNDLEQPQSTEFAPSKQQSNRIKTATLRVRDWAPYRYKEALIFLPGYNSTMEADIRSFGQFLAMTKLSRHVYPFVYVTPGSRGPGYFFASDVLDTDVNQQNMLKMFRGLRAAGIRRCHIMTHSMGVQTLLGAFRDRYDKSGERIGRSDVSKCFQLDPEFDNTSGPREGKRQQYGNRMTCKSITLLNPDFPVEAFADRGFLSIRRICQLITVVGDRNDRALGWSSVFNGAAPRFGYRRPEYLRPTILTNEERGWKLVRRIGRSIDRLYIPAAMEIQYRDNGNEKVLRRLLFNKATPIGFDNRTSDADGHAWMDLDVIDMTGLDTNIKGMRHSGFSLNAMLLKDLEELISGGKRAMKRSSLLYREGNIFTYAHAPAFVVQ